MTARASDKASIKLQPGMLVEIWVEFSNYGEWRRYIIIDDTIPHLDEDGKWRFTAEEPDPPWTFTFEKCVKPELIRVIDKSEFLPAAHGPVPSRTKIGRLSA